MILTANYAFLNYLVLALGILLVDDRFLRNYIPQRWKSLESLPRLYGVSEPEQSATARTEPAPARGERSSVRPYKAAQAGALSRDALLGFLRFDREARLAACAACSSASDSGDDAGAVPDRRPVWAVRGDDAGAL